MTWRDGGRGRREAIKSRLSGPRKQKLLTVLSNNRWCGLYPSMKIQSEKFINVCCCSTDNGSVFVCCLLFVVCFIFYKIMNHEWMREIFCCLLLGEFFFWYKNRIKKYARLFPIRIWKLDISYVTFVSSARSKIEDLKTKKKQQKQHTGSCTQHSLILFFSF